MLLQRFFVLQMTCNLPLTLNSIRSMDKSSSYLFHLSLFLLRFDFLQRSSSSGLTSSLTSSMHSDLQTPSYASDMRILMENMQALNVNHRQDDLSLSNPHSLKETSYQGKTIVEINYKILHLPFRFTCKFNSTLYTTSISFQSIAKQRNRSVRCMYSITFLDDFHEHLFSNRVFWMLPIVRLQSRLP